MEKNLPAYDATYFEWGMKSFSIKSMQIEYIWSKTSVLHNSALFAMTSDLQQC